MSDRIESNHEMLFLYDAELCNPNGDPDNENKPRMDYETDRNLVSDVRLKRYIRDYLSQYKDLQLFVNKVDGKTVNSTERINVLLGETNKKKFSELTDDELLAMLADVRLFGATITLKGGGGAKPGSSRIFVGPVQFNWGYSLNEVTLCESSGITSHFSSEADKTRGAMGKDYRVNYSLIAFHGIISAKRASHTNLTRNDIKILDEALVKSIPLMATRSKIGQQPRLYIRVEYNSPEYFFGDLRKYVSLDDDSTIRDCGDYELNLSKLSEKLNGIADRIKQVHFWKHPDFQLSGWELKDIDVEEMNF